MRKIIVGDTVKILSGKDKGKTGEVIAYLPNKDRIVVKGVNMITKHKKQDAQTKKGGKFKVEAPLHISKAMLINPDTGKPTRVRFEIDEKTNTKQRVSVKTGKKITEKK